ncbi:pentapeptide repeat-containing protein [Neobacillus sp. SAB-20_R2A]|uniref:pentapeptide repeat-containing protein n=1 Tax=Neobacillus sp. SAB-20_R2A TaxID=3120519 RepID=UPI003C6E111C
MSNPLTNSNKLKSLTADCANCFALCCVALPYAKSADFAFDKDSGTPCKNLQSDHRCRIHQNLRDKGFRGCSAYECFGAGQKVSQSTYGGRDWRENPESAMEMFNVFPIMQQLHEMLYYLNEAMRFEETKAIHHELHAAFEETESLTNLTPKEILNLDVPSHRAKVNKLFLHTSELVRTKISPGKNINKIRKGSDLIGARLRGIDLRGANFRGALLIAADLRESDLRGVDFIGADMRDADLSGANLTGSIFLTQAQVNAAKGDCYTKLPAALKTPEHWAHRK